MGLGVRHLWPSGSDRSRRPRSIAYVAPGDRVVDVAYWAPVTWPLGRGAWRGGDRVDFEPSLSAVAAERVAELELAVRWDVGDVAALTAPDHGPTSYCPSSASCTRPTTMRRRVSSPVRGTRGADRSRVRRPPVHAGDAQALSPAAPRRPRRAVARRIAPTARRTAARRGRREPRAQHLTHRRHEAARNPGRENDPRPGCRAPGELDAPPHRGRSRT